jgi:hypothetical protein
MQKGEIIVRRLVPANQHSAKAIHPTMRPFHYPPPRPGTRMTFEGLGFFPPRSDVGGKAKLLERVAHLRVVVPLVQTHPVGPLLSGTRPVDDEALEGLFDQLQVGSVGPGDPETHRHPVAFGH